MRTIFLAVLNLSILGFSGVWAQIPPFPVNQPIDSRMDLGLFGLLGGGLQYSIEGHPISRYEDLKAVIYPLRDRESSDLIREAEEAHLTAWVFYVGGALLTADVALNFKPTPLLGVDWIDRAATGLAVGQILMGAGFLFDGNAEARKFNAIQRYNHLLHPKEDLSFEWISPQLALVPSGAQCGLGVRF